MSTHVVGGINPDYLAFDPTDHAPVANADTASVAYNQAVTVNVLANDTDVDPGDQAYLGVGEYTDPVIAGTNQIAPGTLQVINNQFVFTASDPSYASGATDITFTYTAVDQWGAESNWTTVTIHVTGNSVPGITYYGTEHNDVIHDTAGNDILYGGAGNDIIYSTTGNDKLFGGSGNDQLYAGTGNDTLIGGSGNDTLHAGSGADLLIGGGPNGPEDGRDGREVHEGHDGWGWGSDGHWDNGGRDTFILPSDFSKVTIADFKPHVDTVDISPWVFQSFDQMMAHAVQQDCNVVISTPDMFDPSTTHTLILEHMRLSELHARDFVFV